MEEPNPDYGAGRLANLHDAHNQENSMTAVILMLPHEAFVGVSPWLRYSYAIGMGAIAACGFWLFFKDMFK